MMESALEIRRRARLWHGLTNGPLISGGLLVLALIIVAGVGPRFAPYDPTDQTWFLEVEGVTRTPPFPPSAHFTLGTDQQGRDLLSLLICGAGQTLTIAAAAVAVRMIVGFALGAVSGWYHGRAVDRLIMSLAGAEAAFPSLILGVLLILAFGIQKGLSTFVLALCFLGWAEVTQTVRGQFVTIRQRPFIEGARAVGLNTADLVTRHVLPNVFPSLLALASLEMGSVLVTLGELGFVGIFIGGGISTMDVHERPVVYFSVPEWGAMLSNSWRYARSYPWMTFYPAAAFFVAILGFNLLGMGLQELVERSGVNLASLPFKRLLVATAAVALAVWLILDNTGPAVVCAQHARAFNVERALVDVRYLTSEELEGRRAGSEGARRAAEYIAEQFAAAGLEPAGDSGTYFQDFEFERLDFAEVPQLILKDQRGNVLEEFVYLRDFSVDASGGQPPCPVEGSLTVIGYHQPKSAGPKVIEIRSSPPIEPGVGEIVLGLDFHSAMEGDPRPEPPLRVGTLIVVKPSPYYFRWTLPRSSFSSMGTEPFARFYLTTDAAERLLRQVGLSLKELQEAVQRLPEGEGKVWETTGYVRMSYLLQRQPDAKGINVLGMIPGKSRAGQVVVIGAHYDGLGRDPGGRLYPGAVDNASGVAALLEIARIWKEQGYQPERTVLFAAWGNVEQGGLASGLQYLLDSRRSIRDSLYGVIHLDSIAYGPDAALGLEEHGSYGVRAQLRKAARKLGVRTVLRNFSPHQWTFRESYSDRPMPIIILSASDAWETTHRPTDAIEAIVPEHLARAGMVADVAARLMSGLSSEKREVQPQVHAQPTLSFKPIPLIPKEPTPGNPAEEVISSRQIMKHIANIIELGERTVGSEADVAVADYIAQRFEEYGLEVTREPFVAPSRLAGVSAFILQEPAATVDCLAVAVRDSEVSWKGREGTLARSVRILSLHDEVWPPPEALEDAIIVVGEMGDRPLRLYDLLVHYPNAPFDAAVSVPVTHTARLLDGGDGVLCLEYHFARHKGGPTANIIGTLRGAGRPEEVIIVCAHRDVVPGSPGAEDNGSGIGVMLELARVLSQQKLQRTVKFIAFGAEELGLVGSKEYVIRHQRELEDIVAVINYDVAGEGTDFLFGTRMGMPYPPTITLTATPTPTPERITMRFYFFDLDSSIPVTQQWKHLNEPCGIVVDTPDWLMDLGFEVAADLDYTLLPHAPYASDHMPFLLEGVPATLVAWWPDEFIHSPDDTLETLQIDRLEMSAALGYEMVLRLAR